MHSNKYICVVGNLNKNKQIKTFWVHFLGKNPNPDSESKNGFFVSLAKSKKGL